MLSPIEPVTLQSLSLRDQWRWTWACWWRAVVFVVLQCLFIFGVAFGLDSMVKSQPEEFGKMWPVSPVWCARGATELVSAALGLLFVRAYLGWILGTRIGSCRLELTRLSTAVDSRAAARHDPAP